MLERAFYMLERAYYVLGRAYSVLGRAYYVRKSLLYARKSLLCVRKSLLCVRSSEHRRHPLISTFMAQTGISSELNKRSNPHSCCLYDVAYCEPGGAKFAHWEYCVLLCDLGECFSSGAWYLLCKTWAPHLPQANYSTRSDGTLFSMGDYQRSHHF